MAIQTEKMTMCKDDDRVIESLVSQINDLQEELKQYSAPEGIPEGLNEAEITAITDIYQFRCKHPDMTVHLAYYETFEKHIISVTFIRISQDLKVQSNTQFNMIISGTNYQEDSGNYFKIVEYLKELLKSE